MPLIPSFTGENKLIEKLETVDDSIKLGQFMLFTDTLRKVGKHRAHVAPKDSYDDKHP